MCVVGCAALPCLVLFVVALLTEKYDRQLFVVLLHTHTHTGNCTHTEIYACLYFFPTSHSTFFRAVYAP